MIDEEDEDEDVGSGGCTQILLLLLPGFFQGGTGDDTRGIVLGGVGGSAVDGVDDKELGIPKCCLSMLKGVVGILIVLVLLLLVWVCVDMVSLLMTVAMADASEANELLGCCCCWWC